MHKLCYAGLVLNEPSARDLGSAHRAVLDRVPDRELFTNRGLSLLAYNQRIIDEAADAAVPLLERLKFISFVGSNLDTFFMVRVAGLKQQLQSQVFDTGPDGMSPRAQLEAIGARADEQVAQTERILLDEILPGLRQAGIDVTTVDALARASQAALQKRFETEMFPMMTPLAVDPGHPFPFLKNGKLNLAVHLVPDGERVGRIPLLAVVQVPSLLPRFIRVAVGGQSAFVLIEDVIAHHVGQLFPGMRILECVPFRVVRNWDLSFDSLEQEDLLEAVQKELQKRWRHAAVRLEIGQAASAVLLDRLRQALSLEPADVQRHAGLLSTVDLAALVELIDRADLRDPPFTPVRSPAFPDDETLFANIAERDILFHHPYESYDPVLGLLRVASTDPAVQAIKQTLYRVNRNSPLLAYLIQAAENGKQVVALVELKARFDEETNVEWARALEEAGVQVVYGLMRLKTHCKVTLVVRRERDGVRRYVHLGTGNYNEAVARDYVDVSYFTARADVSDDVADLFNLLTGYSASPQWRKLVVAPLDLRKRIIEQIEETAAVAREGGRAKIVLKSNALIDTDTSRALCAAAQVGVDTTLLIRGPCTLKVGIPGISDRIRVQMIIDRFLEHTRVLYFQRGDREDVYITSTDLMHRNFDWRVEVMLPIEDEALKRRLIDEILATELRDNVKACRLGPDGRYTRVPQDGDRIRAQEEFIRLAQQRAQDLQDPSKA